MNYQITAPKQWLPVSIQLPASKSICNRALILNALSQSPYEVANLSDCDDTRLMVQALHSNGCDFNVGAAGTTMRFLTAFLSKRIGEWTITGTERMKNRPIRVLVAALNQLGAHIEYLEKEGYPPLRIQGTALQGGEISLAGNVSSQYISAILMIAPLTEQGLPTLHPYDPSVDGGLWCAGRMEWADHSCGTSILPADSLCGGIGLECSLLLV